MRGLTARWLFLGICLITTFGCTTKDTAASLAGPSQDRSKELREGERLHARRLFNSSFTDNNDPFDVQRYDLKGAFDWTADKLNAVLTITIDLKNTSATSIDLDSRVKVFSVKRNNADVVFSTQNNLLSLSLKDIPEAELKAPLVFTISYETTANVVGRGESSALTSVPYRSSDPVKARVAYTTSEPQGASDWMPCHNVPYDRALWSTEFSMDLDERLIANGALVDEHIASDRRVMRYQTGYTLPTYLMAFGVGHFEVVSDNVAGLPVTVWHRRGLPGSHREVVTQIRDMIKTYEGLVGPYPFEKYALVLLPEFPAGGLENASITFQAENRSTESRAASDFGLTAHELGHQWFGDYLTVETWDDLWIKEGMAQVLSEEATRSFEDANRSGRFFAQNFWASQGDAIRDPALKPDNKYTTGPYDRAGWFLSQLRGAVGNQRFWEILRTVLKDHAFGSIGTDAFLAYFKNDLDAATYAKLPVAIAAKMLPSIQLLREDDQHKVFMLKDPEGAMIRPLAMEWVDTNGNKTRVTWNVDSEFIIDAAETRRLVIDPADEHALSSFIVGLSLFKSKFGPYMKPNTAEEREVFLRGPSSAQVLTLTNDADWDIGPVEGAAFYQGLSSENAKFLALEKFCSTAKRTGSPEWRAWVEKTLLNPPWLGIPRFKSKDALKDCYDVAGSVFGPLWTSLEQSAKGVRDADLNFSIFFPQTPEASAKMWGNVYRTSGSVRAQLSALTGLARHVYKGTIFEAGAPLKTDLKHFLKQALRDSDVSEVQNAVLGLGFLLEKDWIKDLADLVKRAHRPSVKERAVCTAFSALQENVVLWPEFQNHLGDVKGFTEDLQAVIADPAKGCH